jgi:3-phenylpropionate/cinnamic acid dioxygenase small subunit|tara:strand:+ start:118 stop:783 length:666 start_codon:yes stop_codon:yes gene_type:complete
MDNDHFDESLGIGRGVMIKSILKIGVSLIIGFVLFTYVFIKLTEQPESYEKISHPFSNVYVECRASVNQFIQLFDTHYESCSHPRQGSLHFVSENEVFFNMFDYTEECRWNYTCYEDGSKVTKLYFENTSFDSKTRTFKGSIVFDKRLAGEKLEKIYQRNYVITFNKNYTKIFEGQEEWLFDDGSKTILKYNHKNEEVGYRGDDHYYLIDYNSPHYHQLEE